MTADRLSVIGLISGGKDSFYSLLHCIEQGHKIIALANLYPADGSDGPQETHVVRPSQAHETGEIDNDDDETDLNSFMYQTVGHEVIPLYASATGLPLYRQPIRGGAVRQERDYDYAAIHGEDDGEETESMIPLLRAVLREHPEANAVCAGAILSTYQRTRVESVALRLGLTPLAYLWKYPVLPAPSVPTDDAQLLLDMASVGLDARVIKVASAGLDDEHLWMRASSVEGAQRVKRALRMFGAAQGASLGEGGEFETLVVDGPDSLFKSIITVPEEGRRMIKEGGGTVWLKLTGAAVQAKEATPESGTPRVRCPALLDAKFDTILAGLISLSYEETVALPRSGHGTFARSQSSLPPVQQSHQFTIVPHLAARGRPVQSQTLSVVEQAEGLLSARSLEAHGVSNTLIVLRKMADFPSVNAVYARLFPRANPPSRVTISCGDLLPDGIDIMLSLSAPTSSSGRRGLHVQGRSYWAPANIGPYSQAIDMPLSSESGDAKVRRVAIAGQIPLVPATMTLPEPSETSLQQQITLSLQHLWRIGADLKVQFWSGAVAYFPRSEREDDMKQRAVLAGTAWRQINSPASDDEENENELDPWDLKHNAEYMTLGDAGDTGSVNLPDWSVLPLSQQNNPETSMPPFFAVEVQELPRQADVEWHSHVGIGGAEYGDIEMYGSGDTAVPGWEAWHMLVRNGNTIFLHTTLAGEMDLAETAGSLTEEMDAAYATTVRAFGVDTQLCDSLGPYLRYVVPTSEAQIGSVLLSHSPGAMVPCHSIWTADGKRKRVVGLYQQVLQQREA